MKNVPTPPHYVLTGGPCAGKTTTINELARRGFPVLAEAARLVIEEGLAAGRTLEEVRGGRDWFTTVVNRQRAMEEAIPRDEAFFFDRSVVDSLAYYRLFGLAVDEPLRAAMEGASYRKIFLLALLDFEQDEARNETPEQAMIIAGLIREAYVDQGHEIVEVPVMSAQERAGFILAHL